MSGLEEESKQAEYQDLSRESVPFEKQPQDSDSPHHLFYPQKTGVNRLVAGLVTSQTNLPGEKWRNTIGNNKYNTFYFPFP